MRTLHLAVLATSLVVLAGCFKDEDANESFAPPTSAAATTPTTAASTTPPPAPPTVDTPKKSDSTEPVVAGAEKRIGTERESLSCAKLAALPADATFDITENGLEHDTKDIFVTERIAKIAPPGQPVQYWRELTISRSSATHVCGTRNSTVNPGSINEQRIVVKRVAAEEPAALGPGTYTTKDDVSLAMENEAGATCFVPPPPPATGFGFIGTSYAGGSYPEGSSVTITKRTDTELEGSLDVIEANGKHTKLTFRAPICAEVDATAKQDDTVCCAP